MVCCAVRCSCYNAVGVCANTHGWLCRTNSLHVPCGRLACLCWEPCGRLACLCWDWDICSWGNLVVVWWGIWGAEDILYSAPQTCANTALHNPASHLKHSLNCVCACPHGQEWHEFEDAFDVDTCAANGPVCRARTAQNLPIPHGSFYGANLPFAGQRHPCVW